MFASFEALTEAELEAKLAAAHAAFHDWRKCPVADRTAVLVRLADLLTSRVRPAGRA